MCGMRIRVRFSQNAPAVQTVLFSEGFKAKEEQDGNFTKSPHETFARTRDCDLAGNSLRLCRENWALSKHCTASLARIASTCSADFRTQQNHWIYDPLQSRAKDISRRCFGFCLTERFTGKLQSSKIHN